MCVYLACITGVFWDIAVKEEIGSGKVFQFLLYNEDGYKE
jgi:hypothetical protein